MLITYIKKAIEKKESDVVGRIKGLIEADTYLIHEDKQILLNMLKSFQEKGWW